MNESFTSRMYWCSCLSHQFVTCMCLPYLSAVVDWHFIANYYDVSISYIWLLYWLPLQSLIAFPKVKRQVLLCEPEAKQPKDFTDNTMFWVNQEFGIMWVEWHKSFSCIMYLRLMFSWCLSSMIIDELFDRKLMLPLLRHSSYWISVLKLHLTT